MHSSVITSSFEKIFDTSPSHFIRAPGRVNLIGEHTDYNHGWVLPMAVNLDIVLAVAPLDTDHLHLYSMDFRGTYRVPLQNITAKPKDGWLSYPKAVAHTLQQHGYNTPGFRAVLRGTIPRGAGLSSSAALELAFARAFLSLSGQPWDTGHMATLMQKAENNWVGVQCGIMDQMVVACAKEHHALLIDCQDCSTQTIPLPKDTSIIIMDTGTRRGLANSAYNTRREECEHAASLLHIPNLRHITPTLWQQAEKILPSPYLQRAQHVYTENQRVLQATDAMRNQDPDTLGHLMYASHISLRNDFAVSGDALDHIVEIAMAHPACYGARMTGAGFAGCAVALVAASHAKAFTEEVASRYHSTTRQQPALYITQATAGVTIQKV